MAVVASIAWLCKGSIGVVNCKGSLSIWYWGIILTLHLGKGELEQRDGVMQASIELLSLMIDQYQQMSYQNVLYSWEEEIKCCST